MSSAPWVEPGVKEAVARDKGHRPASEVADLYGVSVWTVYRIWSHTEEDGRYHPWCIVADPSDRAVVRVAYELERAPHRILSPEDTARVRILLALRSMGPEAVASHLPVSDPDVPSGRAS